MTITRNLLIAALVGLISGLLIGFCVGKGIYDQPIETKIERDTVVVTDTIRHYLPQPVDGTDVRVEYKFLPVVRTEKDTVTKTINVHDSVLVEVPIESKHYNAPEYDAWVSGYMPSLDSINVYQNTQYITETITLSKPHNKWELDIVGGIDYNTRQDRYTPYAVGELLYKPNRFQVGIQGGVVKNGNKAEPIVGGKVKVRIF